MHELDTTLVAIGSPPGRGGVGCIRLSGARAEEIAGAIFRPAAGRSPRPAGPPVFGRFLGRDEIEVDHGYVVLFAPGASYTGELTAELWPHGSPVVLAALVEATIAAGAVPAGPGEFTYRALRHGRLDLARAEAIQDLVASRTLYQARLAFSQAEGAISRRLEPLCALLEEWIARGEAAVEFVEEAETHLGREGLKAGIEEAERLCATLLAGFRTGRVVRDGATLAIVGRPNAGKSSLFNRLLERERAIVTDVAGTTRDTLEEDLELNGVPLRVVDTAGLRRVEDAIEGEGVRRAHVAREEADLVLYVIDGTAGHELPDGDERMQLVWNKSDLDPHGAWPVPEQALRVSARTGEGVEQLRERLRERLLGAAPLEDPVITNARQGRSLERASSALAAAAAAASSGVSEELVLEDLRQARRELGAITGEFDCEDLYDRIFSTFCIGK